MAGRNFRLPLWWWRLDWPGFNERWRQRPQPTGALTHGYEELIPIDALLRPRPAPQARPEGFCVLVAANPEALRINMFMALQAAGPVTGYGHMFNQSAAPFEIRGAEPVSVSACARRTRSIPATIPRSCSTPGTAVVVPLYNGDRLLGRDFNPSALVNYQDFLDMDWFVDHSRRLDASREAYEAIRSQPLLSPPALARAAHRFPAICGRADQKLAGQRLSRVTTCGRRRFPSAPGPGRRSRSRRSRSRCRANRATSCSRLKLCRRSRSVQ